MISSREYIIDRMKGVKKSIDEFNFDKLDAPPLGYFFTPYDLAELHRIASSLSLQSDPDKRYKLIANIMRSKGMRKVGSGTNRVVYVHPDFPDIVFKVAADNVGLGDNPAEYRNQFIVRPFVAKTFEIDPSGTVAISERVNPVQSREEFISIADDVFEVITEFFVGKYILADIGEKFFMNWGVRKGFGPVLLDYPYIYELDGNKLYCCRPEPSNPSGTCDGVIDYDFGFNKLVCTKCGAVYRAKELSKHIENKMIRTKGENNMVIKTKGKNGTKTFGENTTPFNPQQEATTVYRSINVKTNKPKSIQAGGVTVKEVPKKEEKFEKFAAKSVNGVVEKDKEVLDPIVVDEKFGDECRKKAEEKKDKKPPVQLIDEYVQKIIETADDVAIDMAKDDALIRAINHLFEKITSQEKIVNSSFADEIFEVLPVTTEVKSVDRVGNDLEVDMKIVIGNNFSINSENFTIVGVFDDDEDAPEEGNGEDNTSEEAGSEGYRYPSTVNYAGYIVDAKDVDPAAESKDVLVIKDNNDYVRTVDGAIITVSRIDDRSLNSQKFVSKKWLDAIIAKFEDDEEVNQEPAEEVVEETTEEVEEEVVEKVEV